MRHVLVVSINDIKSKLKTLGYPVTSQAGEWLTCALDPFHDYRMSAEGFPDLMSSTSIVELHTRELTITAPAAAAGGLWDAHVLFTGFDSYIADNYLGSMANAASRGYVEYDHAAYSSLPRISSLSVFTNATGVQCGVGGTTGSSYHLPNVTSNHANRMIACGVEVHNNTAELNKQGSVSCSMLPAQSADSISMKAIDVNGTPWEETDYQSDFSIMYPTYISDVKSVPQSSTWEAAKGVYMIPRLAKNEIPVHEYASGKITTFRSVIAGSTVASATFPWHYTVDSAARKQPYMTGMFPNSFSPMSAFFTGLSPETTLTVTYRSFIEYFPSLNTELISMASPSAVYDPMALKAYAEICEHAPYVVPVGYNAGGEYLRMLLQVMNKWIPRGLSLIPHPAAQYASLGTQALAGAGIAAIDLYRKKKGLPPGRDFKDLKKTLKINKNTGGNDRNPRK
jgi:hypothetical protein